MWSNLPFDILANIFNYLSPDSLARAKATCRSWCAAAESAPTTTTRCCRHPPWFVALPTRSCGLSCYLHNPITDSWHFQPLDNFINPIKPIAAIGGLILFKIANATSLQLAICNPFTRQFKTLPALNFARTNPAVGVVEGDDSTPSFRIYVAGGMSEAKSGSGAVYHPTIETYDSRSRKWEVVGEMPVEIAVRLTVWTPNESVYSNGILYWMTSARAYSVMGLDISSNTWRELSVPLADKLEFAALVPRKGRAAVVGGTGGGDGCCAWELREGDDGWGLIGRVPVELGVRVLGERGNWGGVRCVGVEGTVCLYREIGTGLIIWSDRDKDRVWDWISGCCGGSNFPMRGFLVYPNLARGVFFD